MTCNVFRPRPMTLRESVRLLHGHDNEYRPDPKLGDRNNALRKADWDRGNDAPQEPMGPIFMCGDIEVAMCAGQAGCDYAADALCDWPMGRGKTCDLALCEDHAHNIAPERDLCPIHFAMWVEATRTDRLHAWPPPRRGRP
jgi:hypothetical protein